MYGIEVVFPTPLVVPVMKLLSGLEEEPNAIQRRINQLIALQEKMEDVYNSHQQSQNRVKKTFDRKVKEENFQIQDVVLKWEAKMPNAQCAQCDFHRPFTLLLIFFR